MGEEGMPSSRQNSSDGFRLARSLPPLSPSRTFHNGEASVLIGTRRGTLFLFVYIRLD
jgi:hypothetical protein